MNADVVLALEINALVLLLFLIASYHFLRQSRRD